MHWMVHLEGGPRRVNHAAVAIGEKIYSFGGYCSGEVQCRNEPIDVHVLNTRTYRWQKVPSNSDREAIERQRRNSLKPTTSREEGTGRYRRHQEEQEAEPIVTRRRARSVAELHPLGQLRYIRPTLDNYEVDNEEEMSSSIGESEASSSGTSRFSDFENETDAIDSDELAEMEVDDNDGESNLSDIDEDEEEMGEDSDFEDLPQRARFINHQHNYNANNNNNNDAWAVAMGMQGAFHQEEFKESQVPYQRYGHTVVAFDGKAYLWGGRNDEFGSSQLLHEYNPATNEWTVVKVDGMSPPSRDGHTAVLHNSSMYIFGGFEEHSHRFSQETYAFDFKTSSWTQMNTEGEPPQHRDFHTACVLDSKMFVFGGRSDEMGQFHSNQDKYCDQLKCLDLKTNRWSEVRTSGSSPTGRRSHSVWAYNGKMYMFGGYQSNKDEHYNDIFEFNPSTSEWRLLQTTGPMIPSARRRQCTIAVGHRMFLFGGTMPRIKNEGKSLVDLADLYVLDFQPSLCSLSAEAIVRYGLHLRYDHMLPSSLRNDLNNMSSSNSISKPNSSRIDCTNG